MSKEKRVRFIVNDTQVRKKTNAGNQDPDLGKYSKMCLKKSSTYLSPTEAKVYHYFLPLKVTNFFLFRHFGVALNAMHATLMETVWRFTALVKYSANTEDKT